LWVSKASFWTHSGNSNSLDVNGTELCWRGIANAVGIKGGGTLSTGGAGLDELLQLSTLVRTLLVVLVEYCYCSEGCWYAPYWWCWFGTVIVVKGAGTHLIGGVGLVLLL
jgi:hypothetical protein